MSNVLGIYIYIGILVNLVYSVIIYCLISKNEHSWKRNLGERERVLCFAAHGFFFIIIFFK